MKQLNRYLLIGSTLMMVAFSGCSEKEPLVETEVSQIELSDSSVVAGPDGGEFSITVTSSGDWRVAGFCEWVTPVNTEGPSGEKLTFKVDPNDGESARTAQFKVFSGDAVASFKITSRPTLFLELDKQEGIQLSSEAGVFSVGIRTNCPDIEVSYSEGDEQWLERVELIPDFVGKRMYKFSAKRTDLFKARTAKVFFEAKEQKTKVAMEVNQAQLDTVMIVEGPRIVKGLEAVDFELNVRSNVAYEENFPSWVIVKDKQISERDEKTGLTNTCYHLHCDAVPDTRGKQVQFTRKVGYHTEVLARVVIKQQVPDPVYCTIPDKVLRDVLIEQEWIVLDDEETGKCDILKKGLKGTKLVIEGNTYNNYDIKTFDGLEDFPNLESIEITSSTVKDIDFSKTRKLKQVHFLNCPDIRTFHAGDSNIEDITITVNDFGYQKEKEIKVAGSHVKTFDFSAISYYIGYYEECAALDVTGMPELVRLKAKRGSSSFWGTIEPAPRFKTIYMTSPQKNQVSVDKYDTVSIAIR